MFSRYLVTAVVQVTGQLWREETSYCPFLVPNKASIAWTEGGNTPLRVMLQSFAQRTAEKVLEVLGKITSRFFFLTSTLQK